MAPLPRIKNKIVKLLERNSINEIVNADWLYKQVYNGKRKACRHTIAVHIDQLRKKGYRIKCVGRGRNVIGWVYGDADV